MSCGWSIRSKRRISLPGAAARCRATGRGWEGDGVGVVYPIESESKQELDAAMQPLTAPKRFLEMIVGGAGLADALTNLCAASRDSHGQI